MNTRSLIASARLQGHRACSAVYVGLAGPVMIPFSRLWRRRLGAVAAIAQHPFMDVEADLSAFLDRSLDGIVVGPVAAGHANVSAFELATICSLVAQCGCRSIFEIGTHDGRTTLAMARNLRPGGRVYTLNLRPPDSTDRLTYDQHLATTVVSGERFIGLPEAARITQLWGDSATFDFEPYRGKVDFVFIDGAHTTSYVANDTARAIEMLRPEGGLIVWHDATRYGVVAFLRRYRTEMNVPLRIVQSTSLAVAARVDGQFVDPIEYTTPRRR